MRHSVRAHTHAATWDGHTLAGTRMGTPPLLKQRKKALESKCVLCQSQDTDTVHAYGQEAIRLVPLLQHLTLPLSPAVHAHTHTHSISLCLCLCLSHRCVSDCFLMPALRACYHKHSVSKHPADRSKQPSAHRTAVAALAPATWQHRRCSVPFAPPLLHT